jgi:transcriptional regulator with XRE-family HTH domain
MLLLKDRRNLLLKMLKEARLAAGLRQLDVAQALDRPQSYVAKIESGERKIDFIEVVDLCKVLDLQPEQLFKKLT